MKRTKRFLVSMWIVVAVATPLAHAKEPSLDGLYLSQGLNPDGSEYRGVVNIARHGDSLVLTWMAVQAGDESHRLVPTAVGVGIIDGGTLSVSYFGPGSAGVVVYRIEHDGRRLAGRWIVLGAEGVASSEVLTKLPAEASDPGSPSPTEGEKPVKPPTPTRLSPGQAI